MSILEFEKVYPESRLVLNQRRDEKKKKRESVPGQKLFGGMMSFISKGMNMFNPLSMI